jgi:hypothetical protein
VRRPVGGATFPRCGQRRSIHKLRFVTLVDIAEEDHLLKRLQPVSLSIVLSGTVQPYSVVEERDEDITFCLQLDNESRKKLQQEIGNPSQVPAEIHIEIVAYARDRAGKHSLSRAAEARRGWNFIQ